MDTIKLNFEGYWTSKSAVPSKSGIYCVYRGTSNTNGTVTLNQLIYIGESGDVNNRLDSHEKEKDWKKYLKYGEVLIYSFSPIVANRERSEAAMIYKHKPVENTDYKNSYPFRSVKIQTSGKNAYLYESFTVYDTRSNLLYR